MTFGEKKIPGEATVKNTIRRPFDGHSMSNGRRMSRYFAVRCRLRIEPRGMRTVFRRGPVG